MKTYWWDLLYFKAWQNIKTGKRSTASQMWPFVCSSSLLHSAPAPSQPSAAQQAADVGRSGWMLGFSVGLSKSKPMENRDCDFLSWASVPAWVSGSTHLAAALQWLLCHCSFLQLTSKITVKIRVFLPIALHFHWSLLLSGGRSLAEPNYPTGNPEQR